MINILCRVTVGSLLTYSKSVFLRGYLLRCTVLKARAGGKSVPLPVASILAIVTATLGAGVDPDGVSCRNHLAARCIDIAVRTWRKMNKKDDVGVITGEGIP